MPANDPLGYADDELKRRAQVGLLNGRAPVSTTMPVGGAPAITPVAPQPTPRGNAQSDFMAHTKRFAPNPSGLHGLMADAQFRERFPNSRIHKNDWVDLGDGSGLIDTVRGFNTDDGTGEAWQWLTEADAIKGKQQEQRGAQRQSPAMDVAGDSSAIARIMAELTAASNGDNSPAEREALLALLQGGI